MKSTWILIVCALLLVGVPLAWHAVSLPGEEFSATDGQAEELALALNPDYEPWFEPLFEPAGGEMESLLFALQAGLGMGVIGYVFGVLRTRRLLKDA